MKKEESCCFSGHRKIPKDKIKTISQRLKLEIERLIKEGVINFICGGALGFDLLAASIVIDLKNDYPNINLIFALPCREQDLFWKQKDKEVYTSMLQKADKVLYISEKYSNTCMYLRNRYMVDNSVYCLCYLTEETGGTAFTTQYAESKKLKILNLAK